MEPSTQKHRPWTLMVYMAGDNGKAFQTATGVKKLMAEMTSAGYKDIWEMAKVGTTDVCAVVCLFDTVEQSYLVEVRQGVGMANCAVQTLKEVNTGDPNVLQDFILYAARNYPADHYALVIWNHGTGWLDVDHYESVRAISTAHKTYGALFRNTLRKMAEGEATRPIAYDDTSKDFLDTQALHQALGGAEAVIGRKLDIVGMDACLMAMVEGARELSLHSDFFVGSQEVEPMEGWPYILILQSLNAEPEMSPGVLAERIVRDYAKSYNAKTRQAETVTQSAIRLSGTEETAALTQSLVGAVLARGQQAVLRRLANAARNEALAFQDRNYRDLGDFARLLASKTEWESYPEVTTAAQALYAHLEARTATAPVLQVAYRPQYERATGLAVYLPPDTKSPAQRQKELAIYRELVFPQITGWDRLVQWLYGDF